MTRYVRVPIEAEERECGECQWPTLNRMFCYLMRDEGDHLEKLETVAGRLQRCPQCLAAEVKTEVPNA